MSSSSNEETLKVYDRSVNKYLSNTGYDYTKKHEPLLRWIDFTLKCVPEGGTIFEMGSGHGRDARYMESKGFNVICSDGAKSFIDYLNDNGQKALLFNAIDDKIPVKCDMIFANAVFPHFTTDDLETTLDKVYKHLSEGGIFAFNAKQGEGEEWVNEKTIDKRFMHYWNPQNLENIVKKHDFKIIFFESDIQGGELANHTWIHITAQK